VGPGPGALALALPPVLRQRANASKPPRAKAKEQNTKTLFCFDVDLFHCSVAAFAVLARAATTWALRDPPSSRDSRSRRMSVVMS
jgi:hypothetical protein